ncbi:MAG: FhaA domain-containing protein [Ornithinimicrobium sp.]|uniref:FhaA domain-containing protein n=1 Tax=Ornithinimicrobium sp. TaxID=1977084 RepID=UPI003D9B8787
MGLFDNLERHLERAVKAPFAKIFKAEVQPVEIAATIRGAMDERAAVLGPGRTMVPNVFTIELAESDYERLSSYDKALTDELVAAAEDHADAQRYTAPGPVEVRLTKGEELETGIFRVRPASKDGRRSPRVREQSSPQPPAPTRGATAAPPRPAPPGPHLRPQPAKATPARAEPVQAQPARSDASEAEPAEGSTRKFPSSPPPHRGRQHSTRGPQAWLDIEGTRHPLGVAVTSLGRDESAGVVIEDPGISRRHADIRITHDGPHLQVLIRDAGSTNGTYLNGDQIGTEELHDGDRITMGRTTVTFHLDRAR